jgi:hypothetical protein
VQELSGTKFGLLFIAFPISNVLINCFLRKVDLNRYSSLLEYIVC